MICRTVFTYFMLGLSFNRLDVCVPEIEAFRMDGASNRDAAGRIDSVKYVDEYKFITLFF